jgi:acyl-CoA thioester hydrolase
MTESWITYTAFVRVRYADTDKMGIVYYGKYFEYFEVARTEMLRDMGLPYREIEAAGFELPVLEAEAKYMNGATYDDLLRIETRMPGNVSPRLHIAYEVFRDATGELLAPGHTTLGFIQRSPGRPSRPPKVYADLLERKATTNVTELAN